MTTERALVALALIFTITISVALVRTGDAARRARRAAPVVEAVVEFSPAEYAARTAAQAARKADARAKTCRAFERVATWPAGVPVTTETIAQKARYLAAIANDAEQWQLDPAIQTGIAIARTTLDAGEYWRAVAIVTRTCAEGAK